MIRFIEHKKYIKGMFYTNNSKMCKIYSTNLESHADDSYRSNFTDDLRF